MAAAAAALGPPAPHPPGAVTDVTRLVRHARRQARLSQRGLAQRAGIAQSTVAEIERGRVDPKATTLGKILQACGAQLVAAPADGAPDAATKAETSAALVSVLELAPHTRLEASSDRRRDSPAAPLVQGDDPAAAPAGLNCDRSLAELAAAAFHAKVEPILVGTVAEVV